jgi:hypothetical protein
MFSQHSTEKKTKKHPTARHATHAPQHKTKTVLQQQTPLEKKRKIQNQGGREHAAEPRLVETGQPALSP